MSTNVSPLTTNSSVIGTSPQKNSAANDPTAKLANEQTFLQLLVAQIKNQNPLNPSDSMQFVSQLAQFSQLEQTIAVRQDADKMVTELTPTATQTQQTSTASTQ